MKVLILSDIHANFTALQAVLQDAGQVDQIWCAGDLVDYGICPHETVAWFRTHEVQCVSGNHDRHLLHILQTGETEAYRGTPMYKWVHDNCERVTPEDIHYLEQLPMHLSLQADGIAYLLQHQMMEGSLAYQMPESLHAFDDFWQTWYTGSACDERRMIFGHTHRRCVHQLDDRVLWLNPGSVSYRRPDDPDKRAHYMTIEDGVIHFHAVSYDRSDSLKRAMAYVRSGGMMTTELQDAMFFFGNAASSRDPLPEA